MINPEIQRIKMQNKIEKMKRANQLGAKYGF